MDALSLLLALFCAITDVCSGKIYNKATYCAVLVGLLASMVGGSTFFVSSAAGLLIGGLVYYLAYRFGGLGAGDVKLMAAIGGIERPSVLATFLVLCDLCGVCLGSVYFGVEG